jgi:hypothetical protein
MHIKEITPDKNTFIEQIKIGLELLINKAILEGIETPKDILLCAPIIRKNHWRIPL